MHHDPTHLKHRDLTDRILKVFFEVYNELGSGFLEVVYERAMEIALAQAGLRTARQVKLPVAFRGFVIAEFSADAIVEGLVLLEYKAARALDSSNEHQTLNYLRATPIEVALLLNFGSKPEFKRFVYDNQRKHLPPPAGSSGSPSAPMP